MKSPSWIMYFFSLAIAFAAVGFFQWKAEKYKQLFEASEKNCEFVREQWYDCVESYEVSQSFWSNRNDSLQNVIIQKLIINSNH